MKPPERSFPWLTLATLASTPAIAFVAVNVAAHVLGLIGPVEWGPHPVLLLGGAVLAVILCAMSLAGRAGPARRAGAWTVLVLAATSLATMLTYALVENLA